MLDECLLAAEGRGAQDPVGLSLARWAKGCCVLAQGRPTEAESLMVGSHRVLSAAGYYSPQQKRDANEHLVELCRALGRLDQARIYEQELTKLQAERSGR